MRAIAYLLVLGFGVYVALKYFKVEVQIAERRQSQISPPPGVSRYCSRPAPNRLQQLWAFQTTNCCQTTQPDYAPPFGVYENQPGSVVLEI